MAEAQEEIEPHNRIPNNINVWLPDNATPDRTRARPPELRDTYEQTLALLRNDEEAQRLAGNIRTAPNPQAIAAFIAYAESRIEKFRYDLPGYEGNRFEVMHELIVLL